MKKTLLSSLILITAVFVLGSDAHAQEIKVGYVELNSIVSRMPEWASAQRRLQNYRERVTKELSDSENLLRQEAQQLESRRAAMSPQAIEREENRLRLESTRLFERGQQAEQDYMEMESTELRKILDRVQAAIQEVAKESGITYVLNEVTTDGDVFIIYASPEMVDKYNITDRVMAKLGM